MSPSVEVLYKSLLNYRENRRLNIKLSTFIKQVSNRTGLTVLRIYSGSAQVSHTRYDEDRTGSGGDSRDTKQERSKREI